MQIYRQLSELPPATGPVVATIGNFDGIHLGHQGVIAEVIERARFLGGRSIAITFDPHPTRVLRPDNPTKLITPTGRKLELLAATGLDSTLVLPFTEELCHTLARDFVTTVLVGGVHITEIHEGDNFRFGYHAETDIEGLADLGRELGFQTVIYAPRTLRGGAVSSSRIRDLLAAGDVSAARALLGHPFAIDSTPAHGRGYGTRYAVPTINLAPYPELMPDHGVYVTTLRIGEGQHAETFEAVTNVGNRPTFGADSFAVESHLLNFHPVDLSESTPLRLAFLRRLRAEHRFESPQALMDQIRKDVTRARRYFDLCRALKVNC
ncbi:MAG TPA: riboflavin biosynthesis protein RibF [Acidobacteriaceae bacterium]|jgi:riboflavin kinase/FMN adenylyltransferase|nr:riboflavin biosynthesis protein RibF [Acidobacteriaceae bacterium]